MSPRPFHEDDGSAATVPHQRFDPAESAEVAYVFSVVEGPDRGASFALEAGAARVLVGTGPACAFRLTDPAVSRRHAVLELEGPRARVTDVGSTNGTWINGLLIGDVRLSGGERIMMGSNTILVQRAASAHPESLPVATAFGRLLGASREVRRLYGLCERLAASNIPVIIEGETGTGKEVLAESIHEQGPRSQGPFVVFDCTAVPPSMMEAELFGHERGSFTGAHHRHVGLLEQAHQGTLLIDEIGDLDLTLQPKLLRAIERGEFRRIGGDRTIRVDVRILAATRRDLDREVEAGRFRDDLFHRLAVGRIELPPLRSRHGDISMIARACCRQLGGNEGDLPSSLLARWEEHSWPGNVRELRNAVARYLALGDQAGPSVGAVGASSPSAIPGSEPKNPAVTETATIAAVVEEVLAKEMPLVRARQRVVAAFEEQYLTAMLAKHGGVVTRAAEAAGIARRHFHRLRARPR
jgi:two-component system, NtrC family, response regulator HydG